MSATLFDAPPRDDQLTLPFLEEIITPVHARGASLDERFRAFHEANPQVYDALCVLARQLKARGHRRYSIKGLFEVLRHRYALQTNRLGDDYKINNSYSSRYARALMEQEPDLDNFFETRQLRS